MTNNLSAVILATRSGPRLKTPIPTLPFGESTVLGRTLQAYLDAGFAEVIVVAGAGASELRGALGPLAGRVKMVEAGESEERFAPLVRAGLEQAATGMKGLAIGLADQPLLTAELLQQLAERFAASSSPLLIPGWQGHLGHPVFFEASLLASLRGLPPEAEMWDVIRGYGERADVHEQGATAVVRRIEDRHEYHEHLRLAGLPVPESLPPDSPLLPAASGNGGHGAPPIEMD